MHSHTPYLGAISALECVCPEGYYTPTGRAGTACEVCPAGGYCAGGSVVPEALVGWWSAVADPLNFKHCVNAGACTGGEPASCAAGYTGPLCSMCEAGYYRSDIVCKSCDGASAVKVKLAFLCIGLAVLVVIVYQISKVGKQELKRHKEDKPVVNLFSLGTSLGLIVSFMQVIVVLSSMRESTWENPIYFLMQKISFINFDLDVAAMECSTPLSYLSKYLLRLLLPLISLGLIIVAFAVNYVHQKLISFFGHNITDRHTPFVRKLVTRAASMRESAEMGTAEMLKFSIKDLPYRVFGFLFTEQHYMRLNPVINASIMGLDILYIYLVSSSVEVFQCMDQPDGTKVMMSYASVECYSEEWFRSYFPVGLFGICVYGAGIPVAFGLILVKGRNNVTDKNHFKRYAYLL
jgi:hypothetical protein